MKNIEKEYLERIRRKKIPISTSSTADKVTLNSGAYQNRYRIGIFAAILIIIYGLVIRNDDKKNCGNHDDRGFFNKTISSIQNLKEVAKITHDLQKEVSISELKQIMNNEKSFSIKVNKALDMDNLPTVTCNQAVTVEFTDLNQLSSNLTIETSNINLSKADDKTDYEFIKNITLLNLNDSGVIRYKNKTEIDQAIKKFKVIKVSPEYKLDMYKIISSEKDGNIDCSSTVNTNITIYNMNKSNLKITRKMLFDMSSKKTPILIKKAIFGSKKGDFVQLISTIKNTCIRESNNESIQECKNYWQIGDTPLEDVVMFNIDII